MNTIQNFTFFCTLNVSRYWTQLEEKFLRQIRPIRLIDDEIYLSYKKVQKCLKWSFHKKFVSQIKLDNYHMDYGTSWNILASFFSQNFHIIRLLKTTYLIKSLDNSNWAQLLRDKYIKKWSESDHCFQFFLTKANHYTISVISENNQKMVRFGPFLF